MVSNRYIRDYTITFIQSTTDKQGALAQIKTKKRNVSYMARRIFSSKKHQKAISSNIAILPLVSQTLEMGLLLRFFLLNRGRDLARRYKVREACFFILDHVHLPAWSVAHV